MDYFQGKTKIGKNDVMWRSTFPKGLQYSCFRCGLCCHSQVSLTEKDLKRFMQKGYKNDIRKENIESGMPYVSSPSWMALMKNKKDQSCVFLTDELKCSHYADRPAVCKSFPLRLTVGLDSILYLDVSYRCPAVGDPEEKPVTAKDLESVISLFVDNYQNIDHNLKLRQNISEGVNLAFEPAWPELSRANEFMRKASNLLLDVPVLTNLLGRTELWADSLGASANNVFVNSYATSVKPELQERTVLSQVRNSLRGFEDGTDAISKGRWKRMVEDVGDTMIYLDEGVVKKAQIRAKRNLEVNKNKYSYDELEGIPYSKEGLDRIRDYLEVLFRRPYYQYPLVMAAEYAIKFKGRPLSRYELDAGVLSMSVINHLDALSRIEAKIYEVPEIGADEVSFAISNMDARFLSSCVDGTLLMQLKKTIDES
jgi:Fe-S-cluster containining protein